MLTLLWPLDTATEAAHAPGLETRWCCGPAASPTASRGPTDSAYRPPACDVGRRRGTSHKGVGVTVHADTSRGDRKGGRRAAPQPARGAEAPGRCGQGRVYVTRHLPALRLPGPGRGEEGTKRQRRAGRGTLLSSAPTARQGDRGTFRGAPGQVSEQLLSVWRRSKQFQTHRLPADVGSACPPVSPALPWCHTTALSPRREHRLHVTPCSHALNKDSSQESALFLKSEIQSLKFFKRRFLWTVL